MNRCPRRLRFLGKPALGGLTGMLIGGIPGFFIGLVLGYFLGELFNQSFRGKRIMGYFENPGSQQINESEPGIAAWCALGVMVAAENSGHDTEASANKDVILKQVFLEASYAFNGPLLDPFQIEQFSELAWSKIKSLNPDLLAESFASRRSSSGDAEYLIRRLVRLAKDEKAKALSREIRLVVNPSSVDEAESYSAALNDPWKILGLPPGTPMKEVKKHYRRLAKLFHPDKLEVLEKKQRDASAQAFMAIKEAYTQIEANG